MVIHKQLAKEGHKMVLRANEGLNMLDTAITDRPVHEAIDEVRNKMAVLEVLLDKEHVDN